MSIQMHEITKSFGEPPLQVLKGITGEIKSSEMLSITGRSGSGKSTLLYIISSLDKPTSGDVIVNGRSLAQMNSKELHQFRNTEMGFIFQFHHLLAELTALENVLMPAYKIGEFQKRQGLARQLLNDFGIADKADKLPSQLSGGEQQRVAIARALIMEPSFLFADEPTGNLDSVNGLNVMNLLKKINKERGTTIIYVTHDRDFAVMGTRQIQLADGKIV